MGVGVAKMGPQRPHLRDFHLAQAVGARNGSEGPKRAGALAALGIVAEAETKFFRELSAVNIITTLKAHLMMRVLYNNDNNLWDNSSAQDCALSVSLLEVATKTEGAVLKPGYRALTALFMLQLQLAPSARSLTRVIWRRQRRRRLVTWRGVSWRCVERLLCVGYKLKVNHLVFWITF